MKPDKTEYQIPSARTFVEWNPDLLKAARLTAQTGNLQLAADLCDDIISDDRVSATLDTRINGVLGLPLSFEPNGDKRRRTPITKASSEDWWLANPEDELYNLMMWGRVLGVGVAEIVVVQQGNRWLPKLKTWHPRWLSFDTFTNAWYIETKTEKIKLEAGDGKWILYTPYGTREPWNRGRWIALGAWTLLKKYAQTDWARYGEKHGGPIPVGTIPESKAADKKAKTDFVADLSNMGANGAIVLPPGFEVKLLEATANTWRTCEGQIKTADNGITIALCGQNLTTQVGQGSLAAAKVHAQVRQDLIESDAETISTTLRQQSWRYWAQWNFGNPELAPYPQWDTKLPEDQQATATTLSTLAPQLETLRAFGVDTRALLERFGVPLAADIQTQTRRTLALLSGATDPSAKNFVDGQLYADAVGDYAIQAAKDLHKTDIEKLLRAGLEGKDLEDVKQRVLTAYANDLDPDELAQKLEQALLLGEFAGRYAARDG